MSSKKKKGKFNFIKTFSFVMIGYLKEYGYLIINKVLGNINRRKYSRS